MSYVRPFLLRPSDLLPCCSVPAAWLPHCFRCRATSGIIPLCWPHLQSFLLQEPHAPSVTCYKTLLFWVKPSPNTLCKILTSLTLHHPCLCFVFSPNLPSLTCYFACSSCLLSTSPPWYKLCEGKDLCLFCSVYLWTLEWCPAHSRCSLNTWWINEPSPTSFHP